MNEDTHEDRDPMEDLSEENTPSGRKHPGEPTNGYGNWREDEEGDFRTAMTALTVFQRRFVEASFTTDSWAEAARVAGSTAKSLDQVAWNTRKIPAVQKALAYGMARRIQSAALSKNEVISNLREVFQSAMKSKDFAQANKASELLGKSMGLFTTAKVDSQIASKAQEFMDAEKDATVDVDDETKAMMTLLNKSRLREGTKDDPREYDA